MTDAELHGVPSRPCRYCFVGTDNVCVRCNRVFAGEDAKRIDEARARSNHPGALIPVDVGPWLTPAEVEIYW